MPWYTLLTASEICTAVTNDNTPCWCLQRLSPIHGAPGKGTSDKDAPLLACRAFMDADARKQDLQAREDRVALKEAELASLEQSTKAGLKTAQKKVPCPPLILLLSKDAS